MIIRGGTFEIMSATPNALELIERAARTCYRSEDRKRDDGSLFIRKLIERGHESVLEHASVTVLFRDVSRGLTHELVRHRLASYSHESTRYVNQSDSSFVLPPDHSEDEVIDVAGRTFTVKELVSCMFTAYDALVRAGWHKQDARQFLPIGTTSDIVMTANFREWRHILGLRCDPAAHWEIRTIMLDLQREFAKRWPCVFDTAPT